MTTETPGKKSFLSHLKDALEHGKAASLFIGLVASMVMGVYHFFAPELEARKAYATLKPVVEESANDLREVQASLKEVDSLKTRLDTYERMLLLVNPCVAKAQPAEPTTPPGQLSSSKKAAAVDDYEKSVEIVSEMYIMGAVPEQSQRIRLPEAPWAAK